MDIFGRSNITDYKYMKALESKGYDPKDYLTSRMSPHARSLVQSQGFVDTSRQEVNAQPIGFVTNNLQSIQAMVEEILRTDFRLPQFFPLETGIPEGAVTYSYRVVDYAGIGSFVGADGKSATTAAPSLRLVSYELYYGGLSAMYSVQDVRRAMLGGISLDVETLAAATTGCMDHIEQVGLVGSSITNTQGLTNLTGITTTNVGTTFAADTADDIVTLIQGAVSDIIEDSNEVVPRVLGGEMKVYLPVEQYNLVATRPFGDNRDKSIWEYLKMNNAWTFRTGRELAIGSVIELSSDVSTGGISLTSDRMVVALNDPRVWEMGIAFMPRVLNVQEEDFNIKISLEYSISGLNVKRPALIRYYDGI